MKNAMIVSFLGALFLFLASGCMSGKDAAVDYNADPLTVPVPGNLSADQVQSTLARALLGRGWNVVSVSPNEVVGELNHRGFRAKAILKREGEQIKLLSDSYYHSNHRDEWDPRVPHDWLENLQKDLNRMLTAESY